MKNVKNSEVKQLVVANTADTELDEATLDLVSGGCEKSDELFAAVSSILKQQNTVNLMVLKMVRL